MSKPRKSKTPEIRFGRYAPLKFHHPLSLFGRLTVLRSSPLCIHPDTLLRVVSGRGLLEVIREANPSLIGLFRKLIYVDKQKHKASVGLIAHAKAELKPLATILPTEDIERSFKAPNYETPGAREAWATILKAQAKEDTSQTGMFKKILLWMTACDEHGLYVEGMISRGDQASAYAYLKDLLEPSAESWSNLNPHLDAQALIPLEIPLLALVRLDVEGHVPPSPGIKNSFLAHYLLPNARPIGHWFQEVCLMSNCANLGDLAKALLRAGKVYQGSAVSHERLKKWARSREVVMPLAAVESVLMVLADKNNSDFMRDRFYAARFLTFVCDLARSATKLETPPAWETIQSQVRARYEQAYDRQAHFVAA